tara:strand:- start:8194 stop:9417 length:1224 start_codon:yes stop_codon:yes gene_type:complete
VKGNPKIRNILPFLFFILLSPFAVSEISFSSTQTFQDEKTVKVVISIDTTIDLSVSNINIYEYQSKTSIKDLLLNLDLKKMNDVSYNLSFEKINDNDSPYILFTVKINGSEKDFFIFLPDQPYESSITPIIDNAIDSAFEIIEEDASQNIIIQADEITTVWSMAQSLSYDDLTIYQVMWSIFEKNRNAFIGDNINLIRNDIDIVVPEIESIKEIDRAYAKFSVREMIDTNTYETRQMLTLVAPETEEYASEDTEDIKEDETQNFEIQTQEGINLDPEAIIESQTKLIEIERTEEINTLNEKINSGANILQLLTVSIVSLIAGFLVAVFLIRWNSSLHKDEAKIDGDVSSMPKGLSIKNDPFIQQFDLAISLYEMKDYKKAKTLLDEIIKKAKNQKLIQQAVDLRSKI